SICCWVTRWPATKCVTSLMRSSVPGGQRSGISPSIPQILPSRSCDGRSDNATGPKKGAAVRLALDGRVARAARRWSGCGRFVEIEVGQIRVGAVGVEVDGAAVGGVGDERVAVQLGQTRGEHR